MRRGHLESFHQDTIDEDGNIRVRDASLVRHAPASVCSAHGQPGDEEILVIEGRLIVGTTLCLKTGHMTGLAT